MIKNFKLITGIKLSNNDIADIIIDFCDEKQNNLRNFKHQIIDHKNHCRFLLAYIVGDTIERIPYVINDFDDTPIRRTHYDYHQDAFFTTEDEVATQLFTHYYFICTPNNGDSLYLTIKREYDPDTNEYIGDFQLEKKSPFIDTQDTVYNYRYQP